MIYYYSFAINAQPRGYYSGIEEWLYSNFGPDGERYRFMVQARGVGLDGFRTVGVEFRDEEDYLLTRLRWD